ncbi:MAG: hypothetical protein HUU48_07330 [Flavobacteriales bacterium]|nr:hypothetical protein [Flavobacteriales bacterium]
MNSLNLETFQLLMRDKENAPKEKAGYGSLGFIFVVIALVLTILLGIKILFG